jgi:hypothetical protein
MDPQDVNNNAGKPLPLPLTNVLADGGYSARVRLGSQGASANLIIDTGSSTLVVHENRYRPGDDSSLTATALAQEVCYGVGGWLGPVVHTRFEVLDVRLDAMPLALVHAETEHSFLDCDGIWGMAYHSLNPGYDMSRYLATHAVTPQATFPWPFPDSGHPLIQGDEFQSELKDFKQQLAAMPEQDVPTAFTCLEQAGLVSNRFAFICRRSSIHHARENMSREQLALDPLNQGWLILGGDERLNRHFEGDFVDLKVVHDRYYNVNLLGLSVENKGENQGEDAAGFTSISVPSAVAANLSRGSSNAILDTGASLLSLPGAAFAEVIAAFEQAVPNARALLAPFIGDAAQTDMAQITQAQVEGIDMRQLELSEWPALQFHFEGACGTSESVSVSDKESVSCDSGKESARDPSDSSISSDSESACGPSDSCARGDSDKESACGPSDSSVSCDSDKESACGPSDSCISSDNAQRATLVCPPECYWQLNCPAPGRAVFKLMGQLPNWPAQSILGLPLLCAYFVLFQRGCEDSVDSGEFGKVRFAKLRADRT